MESGAPNLRPSRQSDLESSVRIRRTSLAVGWNRLTLCSSSALSKVIISTPMSCAARTNEAGLQGLAKMIRSAEGQDGRERTC